MRKTLGLTVASACLALAACSSNSTTASSDQASSNPSVAVSTKSLVISSASPKRPPASAKPTAKASPKATSCPDRPDVFLWMRTAGVPDYAQRLGGTDMETCEPSYKMLMASAPTVPGSCTQLASVSDNPGYNPDATPAPRLKKVLYSVGPAC